MLIFGTLKHHIAYLVLTLAHDVRALGVWSHKHNLLLDDRTIVLTTVKRLRTLASDAYDLFCRNHFWLSKVLNCQHLIRRDILFAK